MPATSCVQSGEVGCYLRSISKSLVSIPYHKEEAEAVQNEQSRLADYHVAEVLFRGGGAAGDLGESHDGPEVRRIAKRDADGE